MNNDRQTTPIYIYIHIYIYIRLIAHIQQQEHAHDITHSTTERTMHTRPVRHTTLIFPISNPPMVTFAFFID